MNEIPRVSGREAWREYIRSYAPEWKRVVLAIALSTIPSLLLASAALLVRRIFDVAIAGRDGRLLVLLVLASAGLQMLAYALLLLTRSIVLNVTKRAIAQLRERLVETMLNASRDFLDRGPAASLQHVIVEDSERVDVMSNLVITTLIPAMASTLALSVVLLLASPRLFLILLLFGPLAILSTRYLGVRTQAAVRDFHNSFRGFSISVLSSLRLLDLTRVQTAEEADLRDTAARIEDLRATSARTAWLQTALIVFHHSILAIASAVVLLAGGLSIINGVMSIGELASFLVAMVLLRNQLIPAASFGTHVLAGEQALERLYGLLRHAPPEPYRGGGRIDFKGAIALEEVTFGYQPDRPILERASLRIESGTVTALVGGNGAGKSTVLRLILGFYAPLSGRLTAEGHPYGEIDVRALRQSFGIVLQEPLILDASVRQNIVYGMGEVEDAEIVEAVRLAGAESMIAAFSGGYDTRVGEDGTMLSGGQRQRIAIARALLRKPRLLILDEPTRHLDRSAVQSLLQVLRSAPWPHATLVVSHDQRLTAAADDVYLVAGGTIVRQPARIGVERRA